MQEPISIDSSADDSPLQPISRKPAQFVRQSLDSLRSMSDEQVRSYITYCAEHFNAAQKRYEETGNFADAGERDSCWCAEADALIELGGRPGVVFRLKVEGIAG